MGIIRRLVKNHLFMSGFYKGLSGLSLFVSISLLIRYLGDADFGLWILVSTMFQWVLLLDFGLASVLKTKIPELKVLGKSSLLNAYVKATYVNSIKIAAGIFALLSVMILAADLKNLLNISHESEFVIRLFVLNLFFFCVAFVMNAHKALFVSVHRGKYSEQSLAVNQLLFLLLLFLSTYFFKEISSIEKLYLVSIINGAGAILVNAGYTWFFLRTENIKLFSSERMPRGSFKEMLTLGVKFMAIQIGTLFLFSSDIYILSFFYSPKEVVPYEVVSKYFQFPLLILVAAMSPLWSMFTKRYFEGDQKWLLGSFKKFNMFFLPVVIGMILCAILAQPIIQIWIGKDFSVPVLLIGTIALMTTMRIFSSFYSFFFFGIGSLRGYFVLLAGSALVKIPITYWLINMGYGLSSVALASCLFLAAWVIVQPVQAYSIAKSLKKNQPAWVQKDVP